jgi:transcriptional regulator with XRE-family HTH domain
MTIGAAPPFGVLLKRHRLVAGLTQEELAERAHLSVHAVSALERGVNRWPHGDTVLLLAEALALSERQSPPRRDHRRARRPHRRHYPQRRLIRRIPATCRWR